MKEIAKTNQARFEWWLQTKFTVLPTDPRYTDLTEEQIDLMYEHWLIDNPPKNGISYDDPEYEKALKDHEAEVRESIGLTQEEKKDRLPLQDHESFKDPDFDDEWNAEGEISPSDNLAEKPSEDDFETLGEPVENDIKKDINLSKTDEWEVL